MLDIRDRVSTLTSPSSEQGLLDVAFPPSFRQSRHFYVSYTDRQGASVVSRFRMLTDHVADPASEQIVLRIPRTRANHNGGQIKFGPDGMLWIGTGDSGGGNDPDNSAQNPLDLRGKMLRIDTETDSPTTYTTPPSNPFVGNPNVAPEIWAIGLRNPWRFSFDPATGDLFIADVGQGAREEINHVPATSGGGFNFGWRVWEGDLCARAAECDQPGFTAPIATYVTGQNGNCSVTGGYVYRGLRFPNLVGRYLFGDYCSGRIWSLTPDGGAWRAEQLLVTSDRISSFGVDELGSLYY
ncbi:MAG: PQQ-dependent sugar dehydrogenase, partial [Dehalococcoidia bacterium]|nr:PQQ-dependent sugar dehydrogenase [Dehalococcoidia bacterium]